MSLTIWFVVVGIVLLSFVSVLNASLDKCQAVDSIKFKALKSHIFKTLQTKNPSECHQRCRSEMRCQSFNFVTRNGLCELNNRTKEAKPAYFHDDEDRFYMKRWPKGVLLGSIPEFPADSCNEIKASEGGQADSGQYWLDPVRSGNAFLVPCDMKTGIADFCLSHKCHSSATCVNTAVNYTCSCVPGWTGTHCESDLDECLSGSHDCHVGANCTNSQGFYSCACDQNQRFYGDGKICGQTDASEIKSSSILTEYGDDRYFQALMQFIGPVLQNSSQWLRCYHAQTDDWLAATFHSNCDGLGATVTIIRVGAYIFGGYTSASWDNGCSYHTDSKAFFFSLYNIHAFYPAKMLIRPERIANAIYGCSSYGPTFGNGHDLRVANLASTSSSSYTRCHAYTCPLGCSYGSYCTFYDGTTTFKASDIEVFYETAA